MRKLIACFLLLPLLAEGVNAQTKKISRKDLEDKIYASWLGQMIGNIYGLPHENKYINEPGPDNFPYGYSSNLEMIKKMNGAFSDDDTDIEYIYLLQMDNHGIEPTYAQLTEAWKYHIRNRVWLANRAALGLMHAGLTPPATGMKRYNPHWFQIDPQLVNEIWAVTSPGMINYAVEKSDWAARITNDDWGIEPTKFYAALFAGGFFETNIYKLIDRACEELGAENKFVQTVRDMQRLYKENPADWRKARQELAQKYYHNEPEQTKTIWNANLNGACGILALLYGNGDFQKTLDYACAMGFDADNQAATMSGLLGLMGGTKSLPKNLLYIEPSWKKPFNDSYKNVSRHDMPDATITGMAAKSFDIAEKIILKYGGKKQGNAYVINTAARFEAPLEIAKTPLPPIEVGKDVNIELVASGNKNNLAWTITEGTLPEGLRFENGRISGKAINAGVYPLAISISSGSNKSESKLELLIRPKNLATDAARILANVNTVYTPARDSMWLSLGKKVYGRSVNVINDGRIDGDSSVFYSINSNVNQPKIDFYGYEWSDEQEIGLIGLNIGAVEENGGWFSSLNVQYLDNENRWRNADGVSVSPELSHPGNEHLQPQFIEYLIKIKPVKTKAIRIIGDATLVGHWYEGSRNVSPFYIHNRTEYI